MRRIAYACFVLFVLLSVRALAQSNVDRTDNQQWTDVQLAIPVTKNIDFNMLGTLRLGRDISHAVDERAGVGFTFRFGKYLTVAPNFLGIGMQPSANRRLWENRLTLPITVRFKAGQFTLSDRNQFERRFRSNGVKSTRYRNRFLVERPIGPDTVKMSFFVGDEVFYDWSVDRWVRNRFAAGVTKVFNNHFTQDFYYLRQNDGVSVPGDLNVIGTILRFKL